MIKLDYYICKNLIKCVFDSCSVEITLLLCDKSIRDKVDLNYQDRGGNSPLHYISNCDDKDAYNLLLLFWETVQVPNISGELVQELWYDVITVFILAVLLHLQCVQKKL